MTPSTPYLQVDLSRVRRNVARVAARAAAAGVALRPHVKTHKSPDLARIQSLAGACGITVATIGEAETFARHGFDDIFIAFPLWVADKEARRLKELGARTRLSVGVDSIEGATNVANHLAGAAAVLVEIDSGHHRSGVRPEQAGEIGQAASAAGLDVRGVFTFPGHSYAAQEGRRHAALDEANALLTAATSLRAVGIEPEVISGGSTPSLEFTDTTLVTELRPGVYVFGDAQQWELGSVDPADIALTCQATVVSHAGGRAILNSGSKILGADRAPYATGYGRLLDHPDARIVLLSEHHAVVDFAGAPLPARGTRLGVVPNHVCNAVNLVETMYAVEDGRVSPWPVEARGCNS